MIRTNAWFWFAFWVIFALNFQSYSIPGSLVFFQFFPNPCLGACLWVVPSEHLLYNRLAFKGDKTVGR